MSDVVKLVVEIPQRVHEQLKSGHVNQEAMFYSSLAIKHGVPLDDVKLQIEQDMSWDMFDEYGNETTVHKELMHILDNIGKEGEE